MGGSLYQFDWNQARAFLATAEGGTLSAAARRLGLTQPTLGRQVASLEKSLDVLLFDRVGNRLVLTERGRRLLEDFRDMDAAATRAAIGAAALSKSVSGRVSIAATDTIASIWLVPLIARIGNVAPGLKIDLVISDTPLDPGRREADIAIRHSRPTQPYLVGKLLRETTVGLYASQPYLDRRGRPLSEAKLRGWDFVGFSPLDAFHAAMTSHGLNLERDQIRYTCDSGLVMCDMLRQGLGVGVLTHAVASRFPELERVLPQMKPIAFPLWLTTHSELHTNRAIRLVFDLLAENLRL